MYVDKPNPTVVQLGVSCLRHQDHRISSSKMSPRPGRVWCLLVQDECGVSSSGWLSPRSGRVWCIHHTPGRGDSPRIILVEKFECPGLDVRDHFFQSTTSFICPRFSVIPFVIFALFIEWAYGAGALIVSHVWFVLGHILIGAAVAPPQGLVAIDQMVFLQPLRRTFQLALRPL